LTKHKNLQKESDLVSAQLHQVKQQVESLSLVNQEAQEKIKAETTARQSALNQLATEQKNSTALKKLNDELNAAQQEALTKNKNLQEESDLLLAQLHQVEEELEKYYLQHKEKQIEVQALQDRWLRAVQSHPELQDFEDLVMLSESKADLTAHWRINQLQVGGLVKGPFEFKTLIENGVSGLVFSKGAKGLSPLHRWPLIAAKDSQLTIIPVKGQDDPQKRSATILQLGTSDWHLVELLTDKLVKALGAAAMAKQISHGPALLEGLKAQRQILDNVPALLRFDDIQLFGQQDTELKSVIGLRLTHADLQRLKANPFEFQLQLNLTAGSTITSAHLIFDEKTARNPFENWTHNVKSSAGQAVMALQLGPKGWQPQHWHTLSPLDQQWLQNTIRLLPFMLATLQNQGVKLEKGWATWLQAAKELVNWSKLSVDLPETTITAKDATPDKLHAPAAAPAPPKAPRKPRPAKAKPARPAVTAKVANKMPQKSKPAKAKPAKPNVSAKVATKKSQQSSTRASVSTKGKRRAS
jgi:chemotaxis protein histidine kinase CheA